MVERKMAERVLITELVPSQKLAPTLLGEGSSAFPLEPVEGTHHAKYKVEDGWMVASHTFDVQDNGDALFTLVLERRG